MIRHRDAVSCSVRKCCFGTGIHLEWDKAKGLTARVTPLSSNCFIPDEVQTGHFRFSPALFLLGSCARSYAQGSIPKVASVAQAQQRRRLPGLLEQR